MKHVRQNSKFGNCGIENLWNNQVSRSKHCKFVNSSLYHQHFLFKSRNTKILEGRVLVSVLSQEKASVWKLTKQLAALAGFSSFCTTNNRLPPLVYHFAALDLVQGLLCSVQKGFAHWQNCLHNSLAHEHLVNFQSSLAIYDTIQLNSLFFILWV